MDAARTLKPVPAGPWAVRLPAADAAAAAVLRHEPGIEACAAADGFWLRGRDCTPALAARLALLPGAERFAIAAGGAVPWGALLPTAQPPAMGWVPLPAAVAVEPPPPALPGALPERTALRLVAAPGAEPDAALRCAWAPWLAWAEMAPQHRLERLRFARCGDEALVLGEPLPPLPGARCWAWGRCLLPAGSALAPAAGPAAAAAALGLAPGDLALFDRDGGWDPIPGDAIIAASRAAVRASSGAGDG